MKDTDEPDRGRGGGRGGGSRGPRADRGRPRRGRRPRRTPRTGRSRRPGGRGGRVDPGPPGQAGGARRGGRGRRGGGRRRRPHQGRAARAGRDAGRPHPVHRVRLQEMLPGEAPEPAGGQEEDALPGLRLRARPSLAVSLPVALASGLLVSAAFAAPRMVAAGVRGRRAVPVVAPIGGRRDGEPLLGFVFGVGMLRRHVLLDPAGSARWRGWRSRCCAPRSAVVFGLFAPAMQRRGRPLLTAVGLAALWTVSDWVRTAWPLGGFSWGSLGRLTGRRPRPVLRLATITGVWGVTFVVLAVNALLVEVGGRRRGRGSARAGVAGLAAGLVLAPLLIPFSVADGRDIDVATLQVDVRQAAHESSIGEDEAVARLHIAAPRGAGGGPAGPGRLGGGRARPGGGQRPGDRWPTSRPRSPRWASPTLVGAVLNDPDGTQRTSVVLLNGDGEPGRPLRQGAPGAVR